MSAPDGLVQRVQRRKTDGAQGGNKTSDDEDEKRKQENYVEDGDSKETRLTLMEEVLLLGLKDREV